MCFCLLYRLYLTRIGQWRHENQLRSLRQESKHPHVQFQTSLKDCISFGDDQFRVVIVPYLEDNFAYIVLEVATSKYILVDPGDFDAIHEALELLQIPAVGIQAIFTTHKHWDHAGHNYRFALTYPGVRIIAARNEGVMNCNELMDDAQVKEFFDG